MISMAWRKTLVSPQFRSSILVVPVKVLTVFCSGKLPQTRKRKRERTWHVTSSTPQPRCGFFPLTARDNVTTPSATAEAGTDRKGDAGDSPSPMVPYLSHGAASVLKVGSEPRSVQDGTNEQINCILIPLYIPLAALKQK
jgi:hypothetical protein